MNLRVPQKATFLQTGSGEPVKGLRYMEIIGYSIIQIKNVIFLLQVWK